MMSLNGREEKLFKEVIQFISQAGMTKDMEERRRLLKEAARRMACIKCETQKRKERGSWKS